jgi:phosphate transport system substrate-binding protein
MFKQSKSATAFAIAGLVLTVQTAHAQVIRIDGSSTVYPITEAVAEDFQKAMGNTVRVTVGISGTGGGFKKFCRDETDISNASRPITTKEMEDCKAAGVEYIEMPIAYDALTVVINPKNSFLKQVTVEELKKLWEPAAQGTITRWNQINPAWPDAPVKLFGAGADSGTFEYFDYTASEDDNVLVQGVARDVNAIGYFGYAYYAENMSRLKGLPIVNPKTGKAVAPSGANVENGSYVPLSRPIFVYVKAKSLEKPEVREFVEFYMKNADTLVREVKYVPLPQAAYEGNLKHAKDSKVGSVFGGKNEVGITVEEIMKREAAM